MQGLRAVVDEIDDQAVLVGGETNLECLGPLIDKGLIRVEQKEVEPFAQGRMTADDFRNPAAEVIDFTIVGDQHGGEFSLEALNPLRQ